MINTAQAPLWLEYIKALGPLVVAIIAATIAGYFAYRQWRIARDKIVLDLFDRRMTAFQDILDNYNKFNAPDDSGLTRETVREFRRLVFRSQFLFGDEVNAYLMDIHARMGEVRYAIRRFKQSDDRAKQDDIIAEAQKFEIGYREFSEELTNLIRPYMLLDHRIGRPTKAKKMLSKRQ